MGCICLFLMYNSSLEEIRLIQERVKRHGVGGPGAWPGDGGPAPGVLRAVSLCRVEDEDLLSVSFVFLSLS